MAKGSRACFPAHFNFFQVPLNLFENDKRFELKTFSVSTPEKLNRLNALLIDPELNMLLTTKSYHHYYLSYE